ncbi:MAG TPA: hypothetical protein DCF45_06940 [Gammaproteobacteria bacterium]|nr:hypothetical protein [Gammaproteobacteria bacterium]
MAKLWNYRLVACFGGLCVSLPLAAAPELLGGSFDIGPARSYLIQSLLILGVILAGLYLLTRLLKKNGRFNLTGAQRMKVVEGVSLGGQERVVILAVDDRELLIGTTPGRVVTLAELGSVSQPEVADTPDERKDSFAAGSDEGRHRGKTFAELLNKPENHES